MNDLPDFFTDKNILINYDYSFDYYLDSDCDEYFFIDNLSPITIKNYYVKVSLKVFF